jgi:RND family efflux transporter MFP subunit
MKRRSLTLARAFACVAVPMLVAFAVPAGAQQPPRPLTALPEASVRGVTQCLRDLSLGFPVSGRIAALPVVEGSVVKAGDVLASFELVAEELEVERRRLVWQSDAELRAASARAATAATQANAARAIFSQNRGISREELENKELASSLAAAEVQRLRNAKLVERVDYLTAQEMVARRVLRAPSPGVVTRIIRHAGESVQINETAIRLCDLSKILFVVNVPIGALAGLEAGASVRVLVQAGAEPVAVEGRVIFVSPVVDAASGLAEVKVELEPNLAAGVRPGLQARLAPGR